MHIEFFSVVWLIILVAGCSQNMGEVTPLSEERSLGTKTGQILGTVRGGEKVCIHKFEQNVYQISTPRGIKCGENRRTIASSEIEYASDAFLPWLAEVVPSMIKLNMRYATDKIFPNRDGTFKIDEPLYGKARCFLQPKAIERLMKADRLLREKHPDFRILLYDCYRPKYVSERMWQLVNDPIWVGSGKSGHNIGGTVDLTIAKMNELNVPVAIEMGSEFDYFDPISHYLPSKFASNSLVWQNRTFLRRVMVEAGFSPYDGEWWHFGVTKEELPNQDYLDLPL
jgi:D-alanyl-D-alanine dipeptidase